MTAYNAAHPPSQIATANLEGDKGIELDWIQLPTNGPANLQAGFNEVA
jgi:hypothetical protein